MTAGVAGLILRRYGPGDLFTEDPGRRVSGFPTRWAHDDDTAEFGSGAPVFHQVRLQPVPDGVYTLDYTYERAPLGFSGSNVADTPLSWVHADAIIQGALLRALSSPYFADMKGADRLARSAAALQQVALTPMRRADNAKKGPHALVLASDSRYVSND